MLVELLYVGFYELFCDLCMSAHAPKGDTKGSAMGYGKYVFGGRSDKNNCSGCMGVKGTLDEVKSIVGFLP